MDFFYNYVKAAFHSVYFLQVKNKTQKKKHLLNIQTEFLVVNVGQLFQFLKNNSNLLSLSKQIIGESVFSGNILDACDAIIDTDPAWSEEPTPRTFKKN